MSKWKSRTLDILAELDKAVFEKNAGHAVAFINFMLENKIILDERELTKELLESKQPFGWSNDYWAGYLHAKTELLV